MYILNANDQYPGDITQLIKHLIWLIATQGVEQRKIAASQSKTFKTGIQGLW